MGHKPWGISVSTNLGSIRPVALHGEEDISTVKTVCGDTM